MLINKPYLIISILSKNSVLPTTYNNLLFYMCSSIFGGLLYNQNYIKYKAKKDLKLSIKKNIFKLFYMPINTKLVVSKKSDFFSNPLCSMFFIKESAANSMRLFSLFYDLGYLDKRIIFFSLKKELASISTLLTSLVFSDNHLNVFFKFYYVLTKKKIKTKKKKLKNILKRFKAYSIFFLSLPKSKKFIKYIKDTSLLTIGLTNSNTFDLNVPIVNN